MKKNDYITPSVEIIYIDSEEMMQAPGASQFDNDGDGNTDQRPPIIGDPDDIGAKGGFFDEEEESQSGYTPWK